jgi:tRNA (guanine37-N1)-methyltransferase
VHTPLLIHILSLFPDYFKGPFDESMVKRARERGLVNIEHVDIRDYSSNKWQRVDDRPFGGGPGMVLKAEPVVKAIRAHRHKKTHVVYLSPQGKPLNAKKCRELAQKEHLLFLCGHYEGIDQRALDLEVDEELSIGDYVLTSGQAAAIVTIDALLRFVPGVLGDFEGANQDSFENGILDCPHYTRPVEFEGLEVPKVLLSGNHAEISHWRLERALEKTKCRRPDLYLSFVTQKREREMNHAMQRDIDMEVTLVVGDLKRSKKLYNKKLGFPLISEEAKRASFEVGETSLSLVEEKKKEVERSSMMRLVIHDKEYFDEMVSSLSYEDELVKNFEITSGDEESQVTFSDFEGYHWILLNSKGES